MSTDASSSSQRFINEGVEGHDQFIPRWEPSSGTALDAKIFPQNEKLPLLFTPLKLREVEFKNRLWVSPMCMYSSKDGHASDFHLVHIGQYALGGAGAIMLEATAVVPEGRISPEDAGIWDDSHIAPLKRIVDFAHAFGAKVGIQLAHAGRKASTYTPWLSFIPGKPRPPKNTAGADENGWPENVQGPSPIPYSDSFVTPQELTLEGIQKVKDAFVAAIERCKAANFDFVEVHGAHGYLLHEFYSPISNSRVDQYGGSLENRTRFLREVVEASRKAWGDEKPLFVRISGDDVTGDDIPERDAETGEWRSWGPEQSKWLAQEFSKLGVDLIDVSSGGNYSKSVFFKPEPGYQVPLAEAVRSAAPNVAVGAVGNLHDTKFNEQVLQDGKADVIFAAREFLRRPYFALEAAAELGISVQVPAQYQFGWFPKFYIPKPASSSAA